MCQLKEKEQQAEEVDKDELRLNLPKPRPPFALSRDVTKPMTVYRALIGEKNQIEIEGPGESSQSPCKEHSSSRKGK